MGPTNVADAGREGRVVKMTSSQLVPYLLLPSYCQGQVGMPQFISVTSVVRFEDYKTIKPSFRCIHMHSSMVKVGKFSKLPREKNQIIH